jgi:hypothetical protein
MLRLPLDSKGALQRWPVVGPGKEREVSQALHPVFQGMARLFLNRAAAWSIAAPLHGEVSLDGAVAVGTLCAVYRVGSRGLIGPRT